MVVFATAFLVARAFEQELQLFLPLKSGVFVILCFVFAFTKPYTGVLPRQSNASQEAIPILIPL